MPGKVAVVLLPGLGGPAQHGAAGLPAGNGQQLGGGEEQCPVRGDTGTLWNLHCLGLGPGECELHGAVSIVRGQASDAHQLPQLVQIGAVGVLEQVDLAGHLHLLQSHGEHIAKALQELPALVSRFQDHPQGVFKILHQLGHNGGGVDIHKQTAHREITTSI